MVLRRVLPTIACVALVATASAAEPSDTPAIRAAKFYAAGLERPLMELRRGALLIRACDRIRKACSKEQRELAAKSRTITLLDELTLFPERPDDPAAGVARAPLLEARIAAAGASLMRTAGEYDRTLIARYGAALSVCPGDSGARYQESLETLTDTDLRQFQGLEGVALDEARTSIAAAKAEAAEVLRKLPAADCDAILTAGQLLMEMMNGKLEPWTRESRRVANAKPEFKYEASRASPPDDTPTRDVALSIAGNFVTLVATELQLQVFPETAPRIKAIAEAEGIREAG